MVALASVLSRHGVANHLVDRVEIIMCHLDAAHQI